MADQEVVLGLNLDIAGVENALYNMIGSFTEQVKNSIK